MNRAAVCVFLIACGSPAHDDPDASTPGDAASSDAPVVPPDAPAPLLGTTCPSKLTEVTRIANAWDTSTYSVHDVLVGKLDNNATSDIVLVEDAYDSANSRTKLRFRVFLSDGTAFAAPVTSDAVFPQYGPEQVLLGDFNGDHLADILISYTDSESSSRVSYVYVATQQADHTFVMGSAHDVSACKSSSDERYFALGVLDVDRDGKDDLLTTVSYDGLGAEPAGLSLLKGSASGLGGATCARSTTTTNAGFPAQLVTAERFRVGDFDGDGKPDVIAMDSHQMTLFRNTAASTFASAPNAVPYDDGIHYATDGVNGGVIGLDVKSSGATAKRFAASANGIAASPIATFASEGAPLGNYDAIRGFAVADFNGDGLTDVIAVGNHDYSDNFPDPVSFGIACDRSARWYVAGGGFPKGIYKLAAVDLAGRTDVVVQSDYDLVVYRIDP
jgi:hypothetical protein